jgi:hypothetical protein
MILRVFRVRGATGDEGPILRFVTHTLANPGTRPVPVRVDVARRFAGGSVEVVVLSIWRTWEDIQAWTGPDVTKPLDQDLPAMFDAEVDHYESVDVAGGLVPSDSQVPAPKR